MTRRWLLVALGYGVLALVVLHPLLSQFGTHYLGRSSDDLHDEVFLHRCVLEGLLTDRSVFMSQNLEFPVEQSLVYSHKSYLQVLFSVPLMLALPWPQWWNAAILLALVASALAAAWSVERLSGDWRWGVLAGIPFLQMPWVLAMVNWGHLPQLWSAPLFLAVAFLDATVRDPEDRKAPWLLVGATIVTSLVYWIWGFLLAVLGVLLVLWEVPRMDRLRWRRVLLATGAVLLVIAPLAVQVLRADPFLPHLTPGGGLSAQEQGAQLERAAMNSLPIPQAWLPLLALALVAAWRIPARGAFWLLAGGLFLVLAMGPRLAPFYWLVDRTGLGYAWRTPDTATPLAIFCLCAGAAVLGRTRQAAAAWLLAFAAAFALMPAPTVAMEPAEVPAYTRVLRDLPRGAVIELPLGYATNAWHLQHLHGQPSTHGKRHVPNLLRDNDFALHLFRLNERFAGQAPPLGNECSELPYGLRQLDGRFYRSDGGFPVPDRDAGDVEAARQRLLEIGVRYLVLHRAACFWLSPAKGDAVYDAWRGWLVGQFGPPLFEDAEAALFRMGGP